MRSHHVAASENGCWRYRLAAASQSGERYLSSSTPVAPYVVQVIDNQQIRDAGGLALRPGRDITQTRIDRAQAGERLTVFQRVVEADGTPWLWVQSPRNQYGWARETLTGNPWSSRSRLISAAPRALALRLSRRAKFRRRRPILRISTSSRPTV
jgi:hypothetical protein